MNDCNDNANDIIKYDKNIGFCIYGEPHFCHDKDDKHDYVVYNTTTSTEIPFHDLGSLVEKVKPES